MGNSPPPLRQSATFPAGDLPILSEKTGAPRAVGAAPHKRYSDETKESKIPSMLRKKSGFSGFMNSLVGSPKKPLISAPENPVHVTHVGYDSSTGQFTVWTLSRVVFLRECADLSTGVAKGVAATD
jgi:p21-activated kinase 1